ncbi:hypothetical protein [Namhaeicola litoreus]|uniref:Outer membrane protein beta-barrel domain-containing protein n=1 Tax=Namhaeicola litoreus TaxID=1052145 RepID=A0ABW3Y0K4_9FLAO
MKEYKNIDRLFQENFKEMEVFPPDRVWNNIEMQLQGRSRTRVAPLFRKLSGVAVAALLLFSLGLGYFKPWKKETLLNNRGAIQNSENNTNASTIINTGSENEKEKTVAVSSVVGKKIKKGKVVNLETPISVESEKNDFKFADDKGNAIVNNEINKKDEEIVEKTSNGNKEFLQTSIETAISSNEKINIKQETDKKWSIGPTVAPVYLNSLQQGSPISENLKNNSISTDEAFSYGVKVNYQLTEKINIQSGLNRLELGYNTKDVNLAISSSKYSNNNLDSKNSAIYLSSSQNSRPNIESSTVAGKTDVEGELNQSFEYLEIPIEMKYNLFESKVGLNLVGGFSTYILTDNQVSFVLPNLNETKIGEANNLNSFNFSGNLGFDIDYKITQDWFLNVTPMVKYQFNTFSNSSGNFQPYYFGVYSGVNYRF